MGPFTRLLAVSALLFSAQAAPAGLPGAEIAPPAAADLPSGGAPGAAVDWDRILDDLRLRFTDPETSRTYTAVGPFEVLERADQRVVARGAATSGSVAPQLTIVATDTGLWVIARFEAREFATRLE